MMVDLRNKLRCVCLSNKSKRCRNYECAANVLQRNAYTQSPMVKRKKDSMMMGDFVSESPKKVTFKDNDSVIEDTITVKTKKKKCFCKKTNTYEVNPPKKEYHAKNFENDGQKFQLLSADKCNYGICSYKRCKDVCDNTLIKKGNDFNSVSQKIGQRYEPNENLIHVKSDATIVKLRNKIVCLCHKYSQKLREKNDLTKLNGSLGNNKSTKSIIQTNQNIKTTDEIPIQNKNDQTGDPLIQMKLNSVDMCLLNASETLNKVMSLGKAVKAKRGPCTCPSHARLMATYRRRDHNPCPEGTCDKAMKNKKTNFTCNCLKKRILICSEESCKFNKNDQHHIQTTSSPSKSHVPLFDMQLDPDSMCLLNAKDVRKKIKLLDIAKAKDDNTCAGGVCKDNSHRKDIKMFCHCKHNHDPLQCTDVTCKQPVKKTFDKQDHEGQPNYGLYSLIQRTKNARRQKHALNGIQKCINSEICEPQISKHSNNNSKNLTITSCEDFLSRLCKICLSKSETWSPHHIRNKFKSTTQAEPTSDAVKWCRGKICSQSDNINESNGVKLSISQKHLPTCDCSICKPINEQERKRKSRKITYKDQNGQNDCNCCICGKKKSQCTCIFSRKRQKFASNLVSYKNSNNNARENFRDHECQCELIGKTKMKNSNKAVKKSRRKNAKRNRSIKKKSWFTMELSKKELKALNTKEKIFEKQLRRKEKVEKKKQLKEQKQLLKTLKAQFEGKEQLQDTNCCADFVLGTLKLGVSIIKKLVTVMFTVIFQPKSSYHYAKTRVLDPIGTYERLKRWWFEKWEIKKLQISKSVRGSENMNIIMDTLQDSVLYDAFANKGKTQRERMEYQHECKRRQRRIRKRDNAAKYSCQHVLLTTLRKHPCFWVYHVCPQFYPQCLSCVAFMRNFGNVLMFLLAVVVWSPCIAACELCRAIVCCFLCTS